MRSEGAKGDREDSYTAWWHRFFGQPHHLGPSNQGVSRAAFSRQVRESHASGVRHECLATKWSLLPLYLHSISYPMSRSHSVEVLDCGQRSLHHLAHNVLKQPQTTASH